MATQDYSFWRAALKGVRQEVVQNEPRAGYWRERWKSKKTGEVVDRAVAIWIGDDGQFVAKVGRDILLTDQDEIFERFTWVVKNPVEFKAYNAWIDTGNWPTDLPEQAKPKPAIPNQDRGLGHNSSGENVPLSEMTLDEIEGAWGAYDEWLKSIGGEIVSQEQADIAGNYADRGGKLEKQADNAREEQKRPHLEAGRRVDAEWRLVIRRAEALKQAAKNAVAVFLKAENRRRQDEARRAEEERLRRISEATSDEPAFAPIPARAGTDGRKITLVKVKRVRIDDVEQVKVAFIASPAGETAAREWAERVGANSPIPIPGTTQFEDEVAR